MVVTTEGRSQEKCLTLKAQREGDGGGGGRGQEASIHKREAHKRLLMGDVQGEGPGVQGEWPFLPRSSRGSRHQVGEQQS